MAEEYGECTAAELALGLGAILDDSGWGVAVDVGHLEVLEVEQDKVVLEVVHVDVVDAFFTSFFFSTEDVVHVDVVDEDVVQGEEADFFDMGIFIIEALFGTATIKT